MRHHQWKITLGYASLLSVLAGLALALPAHAQNDQREQVGEVLGRPVYRHDLGTGEDVDLGRELRSRFAGPVMQKYRQAHRAEIRPTDAEIRAAAEFFDKQHDERIKDQVPELRKDLKQAQEQLARGGLTDEKQQDLEAERLLLQIQLKPPGRRFAAFIMNNWKFQRHLYDQYGGGRVLWQQAGMEAFDAMHEWLKDHEQKGDFKISDPDLRKTFYEYWTTMNHGAFLIDDEERIRAEFLEPEWAPVGTTMSP